MHPYKINCHGDIESDGMIFTSDREFGQYIEYTEMCDEYWFKEEERIKEDKLLELEERYGNLDC